MYIEITASEAIRYIKNNPEAKVLISVNENDTNLSDFTIRHKNECYKILKESDMIFHGKDGFMDWFDALHIKRDIFNKDTILLKIK